VRRKIGFQFNQNDVKPYADYTVIRDEDVAFFIEDFESAVAGNHYPDYAGSLTGKDYIAYTA
jgi:hypothetical protein